jgi:uncharacterized protein YggE
VTISFTVETQAPTAAEATSLNAERMDGVIQALRGSGVPELRIETFGYSLQPEYERPQPNREARAIVGYRAHNNIRCTFKELDAAGSVLDRAVEAGANRIANLSFGASDTREARLQALAEAVRQAREQAETMAEAMGVELGRVLEVTGGASSPPVGPRRAVMFEAVAADVATPIEAGNLTVSASVSVSYRILERFP